MYKVATASTYPGWGYMIKEGATTIWEAWARDSAAGNSDSMIMWATIDEFFYNDLAGIRGPDYYGPGYMAPGFEEIEIKPRILGDLTSAGASIKTVRGLVSSSWEKTGDSVILEVVIPVNSRARVSVPKIGLENVIVEEGGKTIWKDGRYVSGVTGITGGSESTDYLTFEVGSGSYSFKVERNTRRSTP